MPTQDDGQTPEAHVSKYGTRSVLYRLSDIKLNVANRKKLEADITNAVTSAPVQFTMEGASTLTLNVDDPEGVIWNSEALTRWAWAEEVEDDFSWVRKGRPIDLELEDIPFRLVKVRKRGQALTLTFEDREVAYLRAHTGTKTASRAAITRVGFVTSMVREVKASGGIKVFAPELLIKQPIAKDTERVSQKDRSRDGLPGVGDDTSVKVAGTKATTEQLKNIDRVLDVARTNGAPPRATLALIVACIVESGFRNLRYGDRDSEGILQLRVGIHGASNARSVERSATLFLTKGFTGKGGAIALARENPGWSPGQVAQAVQGSAFPGRYDEHLDEGRKILRSYGEGSLSDSATYIKSYQFSRGKKESSWDAAGRLMEEVNWRRFMRGRGADRRLWLASEDYLFQQRHEIVIREFEPRQNADDPLVRSGYILDSEAELDMHSRVPIAEITFTVAADRFTAWPGMCVLVRGFGPMGGKYLVSSIEFDLMDPEGIAEITLRKPIPARPEPAPETGTLSGTTPGADLSDIDASGEYDGTKAIFDQFVTPFMEKRGLKAGSTKRTPAENAAAGGSSTSDHLTTNSSAYAVDYPTSNGESAAAALAKALEWDSWRKDSYATSRITVGDKTFTVQILWGAGINHDDHIHVGIHAA